MIFALTTGHKIGLATTGAVFIIYSLVSAFILPARNPNFPGRYLKPYIALSVVMFLAMIGAVLVFGKEKKEAAPATPAATRPILWPVVSARTIAPDRTEALSRNRC